MTNEQFDKLYDLFGKAFGAMNHALQLQAETLVQIEHGLSQMVSAANPSPNYSKNLADFLEFDWATINATVTATDEDGVSQVEWNGRQFTRRSGNATFGPAVYFSRCTGKVDGVNKYERLITFKPVGEAREIPRQTMRLATAGDGQRQPASNRPPQSRPADAQMGRPERPVPVEQRQQQVGADGVACSLKTWDRLCKMVKVAAEAGVSAEQWAERVERVAGSRDLKTLSDENAAKAMRVITEMANEALAGSRTKAA